uniref:BUB1 N-terminal domain-containing protein n=1 Tax=Xiphophorus couchianus TaxID=32473 RepID=A0A3B5KSZ5_9TELE
MKVRFCCNPWCWKLLHCSGVHGNRVFQASYCVDPANLYAHVFSRGVGSRTAALYLAWARHFEQKGMKDQADAVYLKHHVGRPPQLAGRLSQQHHRLRPAGPVRLHTVHSQNAIQWRLLPG